MTTGPKPYVFVIMPISRNTRDTWELGIEAACRDLGFYCERVDKINFIGGIYDRIVNSIAKADIVVSDLSGKNPNVYYETGYAHALQKVTIHLCRDIEEIPFDLRGFQHIVYSDSIVDLKRELKEKLLWAQGYLRDSKAGLIGSLLFQFYHDGSQLADQIDVLTRNAYLADGVLRYRLAQLKLDILNSGASGSQQLGPVYVYTGREISKVTMLGEADFSKASPSRSEDTGFVFRHRLDYAGKFAAGEWQSLDLQFTLSREMNVNEGSELPIRIRFLTDSTPLDLDLHLVCRSGPDAPLLSLIIPSEDGSGKVECTLQREFNRDGTIAEGGFELPVVLINNSEDTLNIGPFVLYTNHCIKNVDTVPAVWGISAGRHQQSEITGYERKFVDSMAKMLSALEQEATTYAFEIDPKTFAPAKDSTIPLKLRFFTTDGVVEKDIEVHLE